MNEIKQDCFAYRKGLGCIALERPAECRNCAFYKNRTDYNADRDASIKRCRQLGMCSQCLYRGSWSKNQLPLCKLSTEYNI